MGIRPLEARDMVRATFIAHVGMEFDEINEGIVREKTIEARDFVPELALAYDEQDLLAAFAQGAVGKKPGADGKLVGYVRLMAVDPAYRLKGIGGALLKELETRLKARGCQVVSTMDCPHNYFMPGVDHRYTPAFCFLEKHGYRKQWENHNLICDIGPGFYSELDGQVASLAKEGVEIRRARRGDEENVHAFIEANWPGWHDEVDGAFANDPITLYIGIHEGRTIAFSGYQGNNRALGWFGPMGTLPDLRGKGVGGLLLRLCLLDLARQGWRRAIIPWVGPTRFYARYAGARLDRCFYAYRKVLAV